MTAISHDFPAADLAPAEVVIAWILHRYPLPLPPRVNLRLVFGDEALAARVRARLEAHEDDSRRFVVRCSSDPDAVGLRNGRPPGLPAGTSLIYVLFWLPGTSQHDKNAQSLVDLHAVDVTDVLADADGFVLPAEEAIVAQCELAAQAWSEGAHRERAGQHLRQAFRAVTNCLREQRGGRQRSIPFVTRLEDYVSYLDLARFPGADLAALPAPQRAAALVRRWGEKLSHFGMFTLPALGPLLGVHFDVTTRPPTAKRTREQDWPEELAILLAENVELAMDYPGLGEALAGKKTLREQLDTLCQSVTLCQEKTGEQAAREALERFCHDGDPAALSLVEWVFLKDPASKRSGSLGLKGLLQARGRRAPRPSPLDRAEADTTALFEQLLGKDSTEMDILRDFVAQQRRAVSAEPRKAQTMIEVLTALGSGTIPESASPDQRRAFDRLLGLPDRKSDPFFSLRGRWDDLSGHQDHGVEAPSLLLGLVRLLWLRAREGDARGPLLRVPEVNEGDELELRVDVKKDTEVPRLRLPVAPWGPEVREKLSTWLSTRARPALFGESDQDASEDEQTDESQEMVFQLARCGPARSDTQLGSITVRWHSLAAQLFRRSRSEVLASWQRDLEPGASVPSGARLLSAFLDDRVTGAVGESPAAAQALSAAWKALRVAEGSAVGWEVMALASPVCAAACTWVETWAAAVKEVGSLGAASGSQARKEALERAFDETDDPVELKRIKAELKTLSAAPSVSPRDVKDAQSLLRLGTFSLRRGGKIERLALSPYHPLVLRLRAIGDELLCDIASQLLCGGWPGEASDVLRETLESWGLPEPMHAYGFWDGDPLVFDGWLDGHAALLTRLGAGRDADAATLGTRYIAGVVGDYADLFPAASDRLRLRIKGDREGRWAWGVLGELLDSTGELHADLDLVTTLPEREASAIERGAYGSHARLGAFELGALGTQPQIRVRRRREEDSSGELSHLSLLMGDQVEDFQPSWDLSPPGPRPVGGPWAVPDLFAEPTPSLRGYVITVGDPDDALCHDVARAVGFACRTSDCVFRERFSFDPSRCETSLRQQQDRAHWLVIASRQPLYRAVQQAGDRVATLLDFYTLSEGGRPVHICVSLGTHQSAGDLSRLDASLKALLGEAWSPGLASAVVREALGLAPGLAMQCAGAAGSIHLGGLLGLLLTARQMATEQPDALLLALDQHRDLLKGAGKLGDLLSIQLVDGAIEIAVGEAKFTSGEASLDAPAVQTAQVQIHSTIGRLGHLTSDHPLWLRSRRKLLRAVVHQVHMSTLDEARFALMQQLVEALRSPKVPIKIAPRAAGVVHLWSLSASVTAQQAEARADQARACVHGRAETRDLLQRIQGLS